MQRESVFADRPERAAYILTVFRELSVHVLHRSPDWAGHRPARTVLQLSLKCHVAKVCCTHLLKVAGNMRSILAGSVFAFSVVVSLGAQALALGPKEFAAAKAVACIMAQDSLGFLTENDFGDLVDQVMSDFDEADGNVVYAKAVGYFDGLMFGIPESDQRQVQERLRQFNASRACTQLVRSSYDL